MAQMKVNSPSAPLHQVYLEKHEITDPDWQLQPEAGGHSSLLTCVAHSPKPKSTNIITSFQTQHFLHFKDILYY